MPARQIDDRSARANMGKYLGAEAAFKPGDAVVQTDSGFGIATEYDVEHYMREARFTRLAPITQQLVLNYFREAVLDMPRLY